MLKLASASIFKGDREFSWISATWLRIYWLGNGSIWFLYNLWFLRCGQNLNSANISGKNGPIASAPADKEFCQKNEKFVPELPRKDCWIVGCRKGTPGGDWGHHCFTASIRRPNFPGIRRRLFAPQVTVCVCFDRISIFEHSMMNSADIFDSSTGQSCDETFSRLSQSSHRRRWPPCEARWNGGPNLSESRPLGTLQPDSWPYTHVKTPSLAAASNSRNATGALCLRKMAGLQMKVDFGSGPVSFWSSSGHQRPLPLEFAFANLHPHHGLRTIWRTFIRRRPSDQIISVKFDHVPFDRRTQDEHSPRVARHALHCIVQPPSMSAAQTCARADTGANCRLRCPGHSPWTPRQARAQWSEWTDCHWGCLSAMKILPDPMGRIWIPSSRYRIWKKETGLFGIKHSETQALLILLM